MATTNKKLDPTNQNLVLPDYNEKADINVINNNFTKAADAINTLNSNVSTKQEKILSNNYGSIASGETKTVGFPTGYNASNCNIVYSYLLISSQKYYSAIEVQLIDSNGIKVKSLGGASGQLVLGFIAV